MTQNEKDLLLKDLSSRLPYGVKVKYENEIFDVEYVCPMYEEVKLDIPETWTVGVSEVKPYLFPMSSMTEEQKKEYALVMSGNNLSYSHLLGMSAEDWFNKNHLDYRGLIPMGLAIDATNKNIY
jgi:hypothetical protein